MVYFRLLYWSDGTSKRIYQCGLDGSSVTEVLTNAALSNDMGLDIDYTGEEK